MPAPRLGLDWRPAFIERVGEIVQRDRRLEVEQGPGPGEEVILDAVLMGKEQIRGAVERHVAQSAEIDPEHLAEGAVPAQPEVGRPLRVRRGHARDNGRQGAAALAAVETETVEQCRQAETGQRLEPGMLDTDRAPVAVAGGIDINTLPVPLRAFPAAVFPAANQQGGDSAGLGLDPRIGIGEAEGGLSGEMIRDASAQVRPVLAPDCKMAPEIENGALTDPVPLAAVLDQAEGDLVAAVAGGAGLGLSNEHAAAIAKGIPRRKALLKKHGTTNDS